MKTNAPSAAQEIQSPTPTKTQSPGDSLLIAQPSQTISQLPAVATYKGTSYTANSASTLVINGQTLPPGGEITDSNTVLSMASNGQSLIIGGTSTQVLDPAYAIGTQTLSAGSPAVTVSATAISIQPGGSSVVIGGSTTEDISAWSGGGFEDSLEVGRKHYFVKARSYLSWRFDEAGMQSFVFVASGSVCCDRGWSLCLRICKTVNGFI